MADDEAASGGIYLAGGSVVPVGYPKLSATATPQVPLTPSRSTQALLGGPSSPALLPAWTPARAPTLSAQPGPQNSTAFPVSVEVVLTVARTAPTTVGPPGQPSIVDITPDTPAATAIDAAVNTHGVIWQQTVPAGTWIVPHTLGQVPIVNVYDADMQQVYPDIYASPTTITAVFATPTAGTAVIYL